VLGAESAGSLASTVLALRLVGDGGLSATRAVENWPETSTWQRPDWSACPPVKVGRLLMVGLLGRSVFAVCCGGWDDWDTSAEQSAVPSETQLPTDGDNMTKTVTL